LRDCELEQDSSRSPSPDNPAMVSGLAPQGKLAEGAFTAPVLIELAQEKNVEMPVASAVAAVLGGALTIDEAIEMLLTRPFRAEG